jgi:signal transduction histidine kinase
MAGETVPPTAVLFRHPDGTVVPTVVNAAPVHTDSNEIFGAVVALRDASVEHENERLREEFSAIIAHDLRNPIAAIGLQVEQMFRRREDDSIAVPVADLERMRRTVGRVDLMIHDLLDVGRIELGRLLLDRKPLSPREALQKLAEQVAPALGEHPLDIRTTASPTTVFADPLRFDQVMTNLLDNAAKFSKKGAPIRIRVEASEGGATFTISDGGIGIAPEELPMLFDRFYQAKRARERNGGLGLGLYIAKGIVVAHGGRIWVESTVGRGSSFHVWFPGMPQSGAVENLA